MARKQGDARARTHAHTHTRTHARARAHSAHTRHDARIGNCPSQPRYPLPGPHAARLTTRVLRTGWRHGGSDDLRSCLPPRAAALLGMPINEPAHLPHPQLHFGGRGGCARACPRLISNIRRFLFSRSAVPACPPAPRGSVTGRRGDQGGRSCHRLLDAAAALHHGCVPHAMGQTEGLCVAAARPQEISARPRHARLPCCDS